MFVGTRFVKVAALLAGFVPVLAACGGPLSTLDPQGPGAAPIATLWWIMFWSSLAILLFVTALWLYPLFRELERRPRISSRWFVFGGGVVFPLATVLALLGYGLTSGHSMLPLMTDERVFRVEVIGNRWWWEIRYPDVDGIVLYDANELHIPADRPVDVYLTGADVIHSFWVPRLAGKLDAIPGQINVIRIRADVPGLYRGHCAEFCGGQHARMGFHVEAHDERALRERLELLTARSRPLDPTEAGPGAAAFATHCARCHSVDATRQTDVRAPNLAGLVDRHFLGAGTLRNDSDNLRLWLRDHQAIKPGNLMPDHSDIPSDTLDAIADFLEHAE
jgi:cytochrome c oxidase subunit II